MIVAGEASGDTHAAKLVREMILMLPEEKIEFFGGAGRRMREAGVEPIIRSDELSIVGLPEIGRALPIFLRAFRELKRAALERRPDVIVLVDFPDFNLKLAKSLKKNGFKIVYYISPQLWAWRKYRIRTIKKFVDLILTILPFEKQWYADNGVDHVEYVGSPLTKEIHSNVSKEEFCRKNGLAGAKPIISLLPGSRHKEIVRILPVMLEAASKMQHAKPDIQFLVAIASDRKESEVHDAVARLKGRGVKPPNSMTLVEHQTYDALNASDAAAITSGTATLEAGIIGTPMAIVYKTSALNYGLLRPLISVEHFGLINLIAEKRIAKELIQGDLTAQGLATELERLLEPGANAKARKELAVAADKLGHGGASKRAAESILRLIDR
ncbi:MAG: lipid-A-disaccharide synthase, partial [Pyrinomonadaceae bacterium]